MEKPIVAIVGRPNVGKSTLFNKLIGERRAIIADEAGTTRDRQYGETIWNGRVFTIVDTAGLLVGDDDPNLPLAEIVRRTHQQAQLAIDEADVIVFMVDVREGLIAADEEVAALLRRSSKPVVLGVNKADTEDRRQNAVEFYNLGLGDPIALSAYHGTGSGDLLDEIVRHLPAGQEEEEDDNSLKIAIVGRPNVGKSSLLNKLVGEERVVVSNIPGTTRDSIDTKLTYKGIPITLIDTAGIRRRGSIEQGIERYSVLRTMKAIERCHIALILVDAQEGPTAQDTHVAGMVLEANKGLAIIVNKWDLIDKAKFSYEDAKTTMSQVFHFAPYAPIEFISAKTGQRATKVLDIAQTIQSERNKRVSTSDINNLLRAAVREHPPTAMHKGAHLRLFYATQAQVEPPVFLFFSNAPEQVHFGYKRYLENRIREQYGFIGTPIILVFKGREEEQTVSVSGKR
ncbi:MAG TPA: ribosome biogenesis GTPase Der [Herpetosiphon sp.]|uniref:GTPase Der n=1 Tax=Herpetosiphon aurantiacus (strain ATCC 23779 / DSM 785 / 114-95) TaxID=316274 RepID=DER_HERA2|nr:ribosome biogenesis GTPase Der [Herpetosiphon sp.]A9B567.1 RecName: Full=GTPase Der; AltName: Full=GTP-binding protein EngA [Herpetosiphon aurantiacus DSM 785]ABX06204.1 small GTP-binding protein [Herpetosiphon aurantiacus DSM 785]HBW51856.1 ribosome biogenesis GTPase Der [Herpetosiphon sp.]